MKTWARALQIVVSGMLATGSPAGARVWTEADSGRTLEAELVEANDGKVKLRRADGRVFDLEISRLSEDDRKFLKERQSPPEGGSGNWPTWQGPARDNRSADTGLLKAWPERGPPLLWTFEEGGKGYSSPALADGRIYLTGSRNGKAQIICLSEVTGKELWSSPIGDDPESGYNTGWGGGPRGAPTVSDGLVYAISANGVLVCAGAADGTRKWQKDLVKDLGGKVPGWGYAESPLADGDRLVVTPGGADGAIAAFDKKSGRRLWRSEGLPDDAQYSSLVTLEHGGKRQYVQLFMNKLAGVDAESGKVLWTSDWSRGRTAVIPTPVCHENQVYVTSGYGAGCKLVELGSDKTTEVWENKVMKNHHGGVVLVDGHIYGFSDGWGLVCQDWKTGRKVWNEKGEGIQKGAVHYADGMLYCIDEQEGSVFLAEASPKGYREHGRFPLPRETGLRKGTQGKVWTHPVVTGGRLYLRDQDLLFCYDVQG